jgi:uncharacterized protein
MDDWHPVMANRIDNGDFPLYIDYWHMPIIRESRMPRPCKPRSVCCKPEAVGFKPCGIPLRSIESVTLTLDELEALRLGDWEGLYQENAAHRMNVSRQTFGNILNSAHRKVADFIIHTKRLTIEGGHVRMDDRFCACSECGDDGPMTSGTGKRDGCLKRRGGARRCGENRRAAGKHDGRLEPKSSKRSSS